MKLSEFMAQPLSEALSKLDMTDIKVHTNDDGEVKSIELKYEDRVVKPSIPSGPQPRGGFKAC